MSTSADAPGDPVAAIDGLIARGTRWMLCATEGRVSRPALYAVMQTAILYRLLDDCADHARPARD